MKQQRVKYIIILFSFFIFHSCSKNQELSGVYKSNKTTFFEKFTYNSSRYLKGLELTIYKDSLFFYNTCGLLLEGKYIVRNDSLLLSVINSKWKKDTLNKIDKEIILRKEFLTFKIEDNALFGFIDKDNYQIINKLKR